jgi:hypothetical protein
MNPGFLEVLKASPDDRRDLFVGTARELGTPEQYVEKDFWVCWTLDALFNGLTGDRPRLLFKGGTSLSKAYSLISRFSEDIDVTVFRNDIGQGASVEEFEAISRKKREAKLDAIRDACRRYIQDTLRAELDSLIQRAMREAGIENSLAQLVIDEEDPDGQSLIFQYPVVTAKADSYIRPAVKIESGAKSAFVPHETVTINPYVAGQLPRISLAVTNVTTVVAARTFWDKIIIVHGLRRWFENRGVLRQQGQRVSRHYYDLHCMAQSDPLLTAIGDHVLANDCAHHARMFFGSRDLGLDTASPGTLALTPTDGMLEELRRDYARMAGMIIGDVPRFEHVIDSIRDLEERANKAAGSAFH